jgi:predicted MFS family arabinose efflux permease
MSTPPLSLREPPPAELARQWAYPPAYLRILGVQMAFGLSYSAFLLLPKYLRVELGANAQDIGGVAGAAVVAAAVFAPFIGLSAPWLSRRLLVGLALVLAGLAGATFTLVPEIGMVMYVIRVLQGVAWIIVFQCTATMVADLVPKERLSQAIGFLGTAMLVTNALAPAVVEPIADRFGWGIAFGVPGLLSLVCVLLVPGLPDTVGRQKSPVSWRPHARPSVLPVHYGSFLMGCGIGVMFTFTQPYALALGATRVGDFFFGYVAMAMFVRLGLSNFADRVGPARVATGSMFLYVVVVSAAAWLEPHLLLLVGLGLGACHGLMYPALMATGMADLGSDERARFMGWTSLAFNGGSAITVLCLGPVADRYGYPVIFWTVGALIATGIVPLAITRGVIGKRHLRLDRLE